MQQRYRYFLEECGINGLRELCMVSFHYASAPLTAHIHPDAVEICFLYRGRQTYAVNREIYRMEGMDVFMTYPNEVHSSGEQPEEKSILYYMIVDTVNNLDHFLGFPGGEARWLAEQLHAVPKRLFRGSERIHVLWDDLARLFQTRHPLRLASMRSTALQLLLEIVHCSKSSPGGIAGDIQESLDYIADNVEGWLPLPLVAAQCGLSLSRFKQKFRVQVGMPPGEYILREKIRRAEELLSAGHSVTYVAHQLSFSSSQNLSATYKKFTGYSPRQKRQGGSQGL